MTTVTILPCFGSALTRRGSGGSAAPYLVTTGCPVSAAIPGTVLYGIGDLDGVVGARDQAVGEGAGIESWSGSAESSSASSPGSGVVVALGSGATVSLGLGVGATFLPLAVTRTTVTTLAVCLVWTFTRSPTCRSAGSALLPLRMTLTPSGKASVRPVVRSFLSRPPRTLTVNVFASASTALIVPS